MGRSHPVQACFKLVHQKGEHAPPDLLRQRSGLRPSLMVLLSLTIASSLTGCGDLLQSTRKAMRTGQCNQISTVVNQATQETQQIWQTTGSMDTQLEVLRKTAAALDQYAQKLETVSISDTTLKDYQGKFVLMYRDSTASIRQLVNSVESKNRDRGTAALESMKKVALNEPILVKEFNQYCKGG